jgi:hypothetical protein
MIISAIIPTRGNVPMEPVIESLPLEWEIVIWDNGAHRAYIYAPGERAFGAWQEVEETNLMGYGRHAGIPLARGEVIYTQDDDVIVSDPQAIVDAWVAAADRQHHVYRWDGADPTLPLDSHVVCN